MSQNSLKKDKFFSHGKLMLTGEYLALNGARSLALATQPGQELIVLENSSGELEWKSFDNQKKEWFSARFDFENFAILEYSDASRVNFIRSLFVELRNLNPNFLVESPGVSIETNLQFDKNWGLGSSSTLINNLAQWAGVDAFDLLGKTLGGSGYDIAVAQAGNHVIYQNQPKVKFEKIKFDPEFKEHLFFVYLNQKQSSAKEVGKFLMNGKEFDKEISIISDLTDEIAKTESLQEFETMMAEHNEIMSHVLGRESAQQVFFDYSGGILKFLGAWGGDFMLVTGHRNNLTYFMDRGFHTILPFEDMIK